MSQFDDILGAEPLPIDDRSEKAIQNDMLVDLSARPHAMYWRHNTGQAWQGKQVRPRVGQMIRYETGMVVLRNARPVKFGLEGSGDIIGVERRQAVAIEVKDQDGQQRGTQEMFERAWVKAGGIYILARSGAEAEQKLNTLIS